jgi:hypothetical protein
MSVALSAKLKSILAKAANIRAGNPILSAYLFKMSTQATEAAPSRIIRIPKKMTRNSGRMVVKARKKELIKNFRFSIFDFGLGTPENWFFSLR